MAKTKVPESQVEELARSGQFVPSGTVNVIDPEGSTVTVPGEQLKDALDQGYKIETSRKRAVRKYVEENDNIKGSVKVALGQFADEALMGIPELVADAKQDSLEVEKRTALKDAHSMANTIGGLSGFGTSFLVGAPLFKAATMAGKAAGRGAELLVAKSLADKGIKEGTKTIARQIVEKTAESAAKLGVEGAVQAAPIAITEASLGDLDSAAETLMWGGGLGLGLGTIAGATGETFRSLRKKTGQKAADAMIDAENAYRTSTGVKTSPDPMTTGNGTLVGSLAQDGASTSQLNKIAEDIKKLKANSKEIVAASEKLGLPVLEEQLSASKYIQDSASALAQKPTMVGISRAQDYAKRFEKYDDVVKNVLNVGEVGTRYEVGTAIKADIVSQAQKAMDTVGGALNVLRKDYDNILIPKQFNDDILTSLKKLQGSTLDREAKALAKDVGNKIKEGRVGSLNDLFSLRTQVRGMYKPGSSGEYKKTVIDLIEDLNKKELSIIDDAIEQKLKLEPGTPDAAILEKLYGEMKQSRKQWAELASSLQESGDALGLGTVKNPRDFVEKMSNMTAEELTKNLLPRNDVESLRKLSAMHPDQVKKVMELEKVKFLDDIVRDDKIEIPKLVTRYKRMSPEMREVLFTKEGDDLIKAIVTDYEAMPRNINPSGTAKTLAFMEQFTPTNIAENIKDLAHSTALRRVVNVEGLLAVDGNIQKVRRKLSGIESSIDAVINKGFGAAKKSGEFFTDVKTLNALTRLIGGEKEKNKQDAFKEVSEKLNDVISDPDALESKLNDSLSPLNDGGAPETAMRLQNKLIQTLQYVHSQMPRPAVQDNVFSKKKYTPPSHELASFERKVAVALDPFVVFDAMGDGTLSQDHMESLIANYPKMYSVFQSKVFDSLAKNEKEIPYTVKLKLGLLLGADVDMALEQQNLALLQQSVALPMGEVDNQGDGLSQSGLNKMKLNENLETPTQHSLKVNKT